MEFRCVQKLSQVSQVCICDLDPKMKVTNGPDVQHLVAESSASVYMTHVDPHRLANFNHILTGS